MVEGVEAPPLLGCSPFSPSGETGDHSPRLLYYN